MSAVPVAERAIETVTVQTYPPLKNLQPVEDDVLSCFWETHRYPLSRVAINLVAFDFIESRYVLGSSVLG